MDLRIGRVGAPSAAQALVLAIILSTGVPASAQTQRDVDCKKCVDTGDIAKKAINASRLKPGAVTTKILRDNAVTGAKIRDGSVTGDDLAPGAVDATKLAPSAVTGATIQDGAVAGADIAAGTVGAAKLAPDAVTGTQILDGTVAGADLAAGAVGSANLPANAVTSTKILDGTVSAADLAPDAVTVGPDDIFRRVLVVSPAGDGADQAANGAELLAALTFLNGATSSTARWLIKVEPGVYDVGTALALVPAFADLEGSGEATTRITGGGAFTPTILVNSNSELRFLTVENSGGLSTNVAIQASGTARVTHVTAIATNTFSGSTPRGIDLFGTSVASDVTVRAVSTGANGRARGVATRDTPILRDAIVTAEVTTSSPNYAAGIFVSLQSQPTLINVKASASGNASESRGLSLQDSNTNPKIRDSVLVGAGANTNVAVRRELNATATIANTQLVGAIDTGLTCLNVYNASLVAVDASC